MGAGGGLVGLGVFVGGGVGVAVGSRVGVAVAVGVAVGGVVAVAVCPVSELVPDVAVPCPGVAVAWTVSVGKGEGVSEGVVLGSSVAVEEGEVVGELVWVGNGVSVGDWADASGAVSLAASVALLLTPLVGEPWARAIAWVGVADSVSPGTGLKSKNSPAITAVAVTARAAMAHTGKWRLRPFVRPSHAIAGGFSTTPSV